jgi:fatty acid desaturase
VHPEHGGNGAEHREKVSWMQKTSLEDDVGAHQQRRLADAREAFAAHAALYVLVMAALLVLNLFLTGFWWSGIVLVGWGIVLALHYQILRRIGTADAGRQRGTGAGTRTVRPAA